MQSVLDAVEHFRATEPKRSVMAWVDGRGRIQETLTYGDLHFHIEGWANDLRYYHLESGSRIALLFEPGLDFILAFLACQRVGLIPVPLKFPVNSEQMKNLTHILEDCQPALTLSSSSQPACYSGSAKWIELKRKKGSVKPHSPQASQIEHSTAFIQYTSGSTGYPKGVTVTHSNLHHNFNISSYLLGRRELDGTPRTLEQFRMVSWLPAYHDMGLIFKFLYPIRTGSMVFLMSPITFFSNPNIFLQVVSDVRANCFGVPDSSMQFMSKYFDGRPLDLSSLTRISISAEPVRAATLAEFYKTFSSYGLKRKALRPTYGLAESTLLVSGTDTEEWLEDGERVSCGSPIESVDLKIVNPQTLEVCGEGEEGEIWTNSPSVASGYFRNELETKAVFKNTLPSESQDKYYLRTGDLGYQRAGQLFISGRLKDLIIINGQNFHPEDIEDTVENCPSLRPQRIVAFSEETLQETQLIILGELKSKSTIPDLEAIANKVLKTHGIMPDQIAVYPPKSIPKTTSGKSRRKFTRQLWQESEIKAVATYHPKKNLAESPDIDYVLAKHAYIFQYDRRLKSKKTLRDLGVASIDLARLGFELSRRFTQYDDAQIDLTTLYDLTLSDCYQLLGDQPNIQFDLLARVKNNSSQDLSALIRKDSQLSRLELPSNSVEIREPRKALLTGATGFVGAFLLYELLYQTDYEIYLLVRSRGLEHAAYRIKKNLKKYQLIEDSDWLSIKRRLHFLPGDLEEKHFGLGVKKWDLLCDEIDVLYHNGCSVNYVAAYEAMRRASVVGTRTMIELSSTKKLKTFHHISSTIIFGWAQGIILEDDRHTSMTKVDFGYSQSKWASEQLVWSAGDQGIPVRIYRPAMLTASGKRQCSSDDIVTALFVYLINHEIFIDIPNQISLLPVDVFSKRLVALSLLKDPPNQSFMLTMPYENFPRICDSMTRQFGLKFRALTSKRKAGW